MLQMQGCSINRHLLEEVKERERGAEAQLERRRKLLDDANMDADLKRLARESSELAAKASALRKVSTRALRCPQVTGHLGPQISLLVLGFTAWGIPQVDT